MGNHKTVDCFHFCQRAQYCLSTTVPLSMYGLSWCAQSCPLKHRFKDREIAVKVLKKHFFLEVCLLSGLLTWVSHLLGSSNHLYVTCTFWWDWKCEICEFLWLWWIVAEVLTVLDGRCSSRTKEGLLAISRKAGLPGARYKSKHDHRRNDCQKSNILTSVPYKIPYFSFCHTMFLVSSCTTAKLVGNLEFHEYPCIKAQAYFKSPKFPAN